MRLRNRLRSDGVATIITGTAAGQLVAVLVAPVLSRFYSPAELGIFATCLAFALILSTMATFRYDLAVPVAADDSDGSTLARLAMGLALVSCAFATVLLGLFGGSLEKVPGMASLGPWLWLVPALSFITATCITLNQLAVRRGMFVAIGRRSFLQQTVAALSQLGAVPVGLGPGGLLLGFGLGQTIASASLLRGLRVFDLGERRISNPTGYWMLARRYRRFPLYLGPAGVLNVLALQLPVLLISGLYGSDPAGWLSLTQRVLALPVTLIGTAVGQVYVARLAHFERERMSGSYALFIRTSRNLALSSTIPLMVLIFFGPWVFATVFGSDWSTSGVYAQALSIALASQMITAPVSQTLIVMGRAKSQFAWDAVRVGVMLGAVWSTRHLGGSAAAAVWVISAVLTTSYALLWVLSLRVVRRGKS